MNDTTRPTASWLLRSMKNSLTTTTAMNDAPAIQTTRRTKRTPTTIADKPVKAHAMDSEACKAVESNIDSELNGTSPQWCTVLTIDMVMKTVPAAPAASGTPTRL